MDLNRLRNNLNKRDWNGKSKKTNINYLKSKLKEFDMDIPKYLKQGKLTESNINALTNKLIRAIDNRREIQRKTPTLPSKEKALKHLQKTIDKHNKTVLKKIPILQEKYNITERQLNYLMGYATQFDYGAYNNSYAFSFTRDNSQFKLLQDDLDFNKVSTIIAYDKQIQEQTKRLSSTNIIKEIVTGVKIKTQLKSKLKEWENDNVMSSENRKQLLSSINSLTPIQKEILFKMMNASGMFAVKYSRKGNDEDDEELEYNLSRKVSILISKAREF